MKKGGPSLLIGGTGTASPTVVGAAATVGVVGITTACCNCCENTQPATPPTIIKQSTTYTLTPGAGNESLDFPPRQIECNANRALKGKRTVEKKKKLKNDPRT